MASQNFKPEDYSRFLIREFLKKNGFDKTYDQFIKEDTRPKVTMTKNELMKLLGIEALMKKNSKNKEFETMLDIVCDFLVCCRKLTGGVLPPQESTISKANSSLVTNDTSTTESTKNSQQQQQPIVGGANALRKAGSQVRKPIPQPNQTAKTQANWFQQKQEAEAKPVIEKKPVNLQKHNSNQQAEVDDWDLEEDSKADGYLPVTKTRVQNQQQDPWGHVQANNRPQTSNIISGQQRYIPNPQSMKRKAQATNDAGDIDELDDLMGFGGGSEDKNPGKKPDQMRDTLGFLKKSEQEKKLREEQKKQNQLDQNQQYKNMNELKYQLSGYVQENDGQFDYNMGALSASSRQNIRQYYQDSNITQTESQEIRKLLFKNPNSNFHDSWHQGFFFDQKLNYGIYQKEGGPCGILATVEAFFLKHLLYISQIQLSKIPKEKRDNYIAAAIVDILLNSTDENKYKINLVIPASSQNPKNPIIPTQCQKLIIKTFDKKILFDIVKDNINYFVSADGHGVILLVYSAILTKGIDNIKSDMDVQDNALLTEHGYASQELINLMLVGKSASNVFDGDKDIGDNFILKGIHKQSDVGFLTLFEAYGYFQVGNFLKNPKVPIWIICSESHYSVIFSTDFSLASKKQQVFDLVYYDELARQEDDYIMTVKLGAYKGPINLQETTEMIPPIDAVIRTKWDHGLVSWNGRQAIL